MLHSVHAVWMRGNYEFSTLHFPVFQELPRRSTYIFVADSLCGQDSGYCCQKDAVTSWLLQVSTGVSNL